VSARAVALGLVLLAAGPARAGGHRLALLVGADHGDGGEAELRYAAAEALRLGAVLRDVGDFAADDVVVLAEATPDTLAQALAQLRARAAAVPANEDGVLLFVFYSGHADGESLHLGGGHASLAALRDAVGDTPAAARVLVVDACRSGTLTRVKGGHAGPAFDVHLDPPLGARGFAILTSSAAGEDAQESDDIGSSLFTHFFTSALLGAGDKNGDGDVTLEEAFAYASERTIAAAGSSLMGPQHPTFHYDLGGRAGLVLTHPGHLNAHTGRVQFPEAGWYLVRRPDGPIMAELHATRPDQSLALPAGQYRLSRRLPDHYLEGDITIVPGATATLEPKHLSRFSYPRGVRKGPFDVTSLAETPRLYRKWWLWTMVGAAAAGIGVGLGVGLRPRAESSFKGLTF
jgi:hypothetical protein